ncbi:minor capsid protein [Lacrimispora sp. BS-2]|uniref:Minor capsid protein n=1 Tax=Lacrimispora sp. BS-2 TaxID=3151850 RepID=A0AAU7PSE7_9FIRM
MLALKDIRRYVSSLGIAADDNVYIGKMDNKKQKSIGVYSRPTTGLANIAIGGMECTTYDTRPVSLLVHWNKCKDDAERAAFDLFEKLKSVSSLTIGDTHINYLRLMVPEPQDVGSDDSGVYEYVIWLDFVYERNR